MTEHKFTEIEKVLKIREERRIALEIEAIALKQRKQAGIEIRDRITLMDYNFFTKEPVLGIFAQVAGAIDQLLPGPVLFVNYFKNIRRTSLELRIPFGVYEMAIKHYRFYVNRTPDEVHVKEIEMYLEHYPPYPSESYYSQENLSKPLDLNNSELMVQVLDRYFASRLGSFTPYRRSAVEDKDLWRGISLERVLYPVQ